MSRWASAEPFTMLKFSQLRSGPPTEREGGGDNFAPPF